MKELPSLSGGRPLTPLRSQIHSRDDPAVTSKASPKSMMGHTQKVASGGFLHVSVTRTGDARFEFFDENGESLYRTVKQKQGD